MIPKIGRSANLYRAAILLLLFGTALLVGGASFRRGGAAQRAVQTSHRRLQELTWIGNPPPSNALPLSECEGDCDGDQDCQVCNVISYH